MKNYYLIGSYQNKSTEHTETNGMSRVSVPLLSKDDTFNFGIGTVLKKLQTKGIYPTEDGFDILALAALVYLADTRISRVLHSQDSWTREISIELPVLNSTKWNENKELFSRMLNFLTGDKWSLAFTQRDRIFAGEQQAQLEPPLYDIVTLFSGGMDSLISTINHLENKKKVALISHAGDGYTKNTQKNLMQSFSEKYPENKPAYNDLWMVFNKDILPGGEIENSTRSRSFLFIAFGIFTLSGISGATTLQVPENGLIALNVPLDDLRVGSYSTRTTHPFYIGLWNAVLAGLGIGLTVENPHWNRTKGEMADECLNKEFLLQMIPVSISCSSPQKARWSGFKPQHCGYCVPCLIRRAAMQKAFGFGIDPTTYTKSSVRQLITNHDQGEGTQLRSFQFAIKRITEQPKSAQFLIHKTGSLVGNSSYLQELAGVYQRGLLEVNDFIEKSIAQEH